MSASVLERVQRLILGWLCYQVVRFWPGRTLPDVSGNRNRAFAWVLGWAGFYADPPWRIPPSCTDCRYFSPGKYSDEFRRSVCIRRYVEAGRSPEQIRRWLIAAPYCVKQRAHGWLLAHFFEECGREGRFWREP